ncbi:MAG TPA: ABC transporter ATP-binding protein [Allosphingosinicella sp.]|nr:ABC transporter ATP-binding protein [Allosphingosinicella sp.]
MRIETEALTVYRGATRAVDQVSLAIEAGRWTGLIGANGSGKTSLLRALAGRIDPAGGRILADGEDRAADRAWRARNIGFAPEASALPASLSGRELFAILAAEIPGEADADPLRPLRRALDFDPFLDRRIGALSAGMRQRLAIFAAFLARPRAAILDEPFNWLDPICAFDTKEALKVLVIGEQLTLVSALHETATLISYCDSGLLLADGRLGLSLGAADIAAGARDYPAFEASIIASLRGAAHPVVSPDASA